MGGRDPGYFAAKTCAILSSVVEGVGAGRHDPLVVVAAAAGQPRAGGASFLLPLLPLLLAPRDSGGVEGDRGGSTPAAAGRPRATRRGHWRASARRAVDGGGQERQERDEAGGGGGGERRPPSPPHDARLAEALSAKGGGGVRRAAEWSWTCGLRERRRGICW
jgi:hypothetical protein